MPQGSGRPAPKVTLLPDMILEGQVSRLYDHGALMRFGHGTTALLPVSEISRQFVKHPSDMLKMGSRLTVKVLSVVYDPDGTVKATVSAKELSEPPVCGKARVGSESVGLPSPKVTLMPDMILEGEVVRVYGYGALMRFGPGTTAILPVREISRHFVRHPGDVLKKGSRLTVKVLSVGHDADGSVRATVSAKELVQTPPEQSALPAPNAILPGTIASISEQHVFVRVQGAPVDMLCPRLNRSLSVGQGVSVKVVKADAVARKLRGRIVRMTPKGVG